MNVQIKGNTYPVREQLKALGARWDAAAKCWTVAADKADQARAIVAGAPVATPGKCHDCGAPCKPPYTTCWPCKAKRALGAGKCPRCGDPLSTWDRRHGMKLCGECRDGGARAHGGQSYRDRHGNFVLGEDD